MVGITPIEGSFGFIRVMELCNDPGYFYPNDPNDPSSNKSF